uniref:Uncharacterized protein n=1 Tax=Cacopsylla melanoneura TaxID=428564 RepID=A0A8D8SBN8_9HEMI
MSKSVQSDFSSAGDSKCSESTLSSIHCNSSLQTNKNNVQDPPYLQSNYSKESFEFTLSSIHPSAGDSNYSQQIEMSKSFQSDFSSAGDSNYSQDETNDWLDWIQINKMKCVAPQCKKILIMKKSTLILLFYPFVQISR